MTTSQFELRLRTILEAYSLPGALVALGIETPRVYLKDAAGDVLLAASNALPTNATTGYAKGCLFIKTDAATTVRGLYENIGTKTSCLFQGIGTIRAADIELTAGKIIYGVAPGVGSEKVLSVAASPYQAHLHELVTPDAAGVGVHAAVAEGDANAFPGPFTDPDMPRNLKVDFAAGWQGGDVTVTGTDQFDAAVSEVFTTNPGAVVVGVKIFKTVTAASKAAILGAADTATLLTGDKLGIPHAILDTFGMLTVAGVTEVVTYDTAYHGFTPLTVPTGLISYIALFHAAHTHTLVYT